jgi:hypothetical protein
LALNTNTIIKGFGRQKVFPPVGRCIYCFVEDCDLGDEHIIPQALGGNMILREASCPNCEREIGAKLEGGLTHKTKGMFAALRLRQGYKSKRPKDRPKSLPFTIIGRDGIHRLTEIPADKVPRHWTTYVTRDSPGIILGRGRHESALGGVYTKYNEEDLRRLLRPGQSIRFQGSGDIRDLARMIAKIAHAVAVAVHGLDSFEPWLPNFILGRDDCALHYYVAGHDNNTMDRQGDHQVSLGTWENDGLRLGATVRLFCRFGFPSYEVAVGTFKEPRQEELPTE